MNNSFEYLRPTTPVEACNLKAKYGKRARFWAGGTDLLLEWQDEIVDLDYAIDLTFVSDLDYIRCNSDELCIGSLTKVSALQGSADIMSRTSALSEAANQMATPQIRNIATIGGNLCHAAPSADLAVPLLVLGAEAKLLSASGERWVAMDEFFRGLNQTVLSENELLAEIKVHESPSDTASSFLKVGRTIVDIALVNAAVRITMDEKGTFSDVRIAIGAVASTPIRSKAAEELLLDENIANVGQALLQEVSHQAAEQTKPITDVRASAEYRREISRVLVKRAIENIIQQLERRQRI
jgi:carbon-monoxide dehydrogenase medium subunit